MVISKEINRGSAWQTSSTLLSGMSNFFFLWVAVQKTTPNLFGTFIILTTGASIVFFLLNLGFKQAIFRQTDNISRISYLCVGNSVTLTFTVIGGLLSFCLILIFKDWLALVITLGVVSLISLNENYSALLRSEKRYKHDSLSKISAKLLFLVLLAFIYFKPDRLSIYGLVATWGFSHLLLCGLYVFIIGILPRWTRLDGKIMTRCLPLLFVELMSLLYFKSDLFVIKYVLGEDLHLAEYGLASRILEGFIFVLSPIIMVITKENNFEKLISLTTRSLISWLIILSICGLFILLASLLLGQHIFSALFPQDYKQTFEYFIVLSVSLIFLIPNILLGQLVINYGLESNYLKICTLILGINVIGNFIALEQYGILGAAWLTVVCEVVLFIGLGGILRKKISDSSP